MPLATLSTTSICSSMMAALLDPGCDSPSSTEEGGKPEKAQTFDFPKLPFEIRLMIWRLAMRPQDIVVWQNRTGTKFRHQFSRIQIPAILHACQESRNEVLPKYALLSLEDEEDPQLQPEPRYQLRPRRCPLPPSSPQWYVNFNIDTFVFAGPDYDLDGAFKAMGERSQMIQSLAFGMGWYGSIRPEKLETVRLKLPNLTAIYIHVGSAVQHRDVVVYDPRQLHPQPFIEVHNPRHPQTFAGRGATRKEWSWPGYIASLKEHITEFWKGPQPLPFQGIVASENIGFPRDPTFYLGEVRSWMKVE